MSLRQRCSLPSPHHQTSSPWKLRAKVASGTCTVPYRRSVCSGTITTSAAIYPDEVPESTQRSRQTTKVARVLPRSRSDSPQHAVQTTQSLRAPVVKSLGLHRRHSPLAELPTLLSRHLKGRRRATLSGLHVSNREPTNASSTPHDGKTDDGRELMLPHQGQCGKENNSAGVLLRFQNNEAAMVSLAELGGSVVPRHVECADAGHLNKNKTVDPELVEAAMLAGLDSTRVLKSSQATARLLLLHILQSSRARCGVTTDSEGAVISETGGIGRATIERLFFASLPKDLIEVVAVQEIIEADATNDFLRLLAAKGSCNADVGFCMHGSNVSDVTALAGKSHQFASQSAGENDENAERCMLIVLIIAGSSFACNENAALPTCLVTYRLSDQGNSLAHGARQKRFEEVLDHAVERAALLSEESVH